jgi:hypothetical protein
MKTNQQWWKADKGAIASRITEVADKIERDQSTRRLRWAENWSKYENRFIPNLDDSSWAIGLALGPEDTTENVAGGAIDALCAKISTSSPRLVFTSSDGDWDLQRRAKLLTQGVEGIFQTSGAYDESMDSFLAGCIFDFGAMKWYADHDKNQVCCENINPDDIKVDYVDGQYCRPRSMVHVKTMSKGVLREIAKGKGWESSAVENAVMTRRKLVQIHEMISDPVSVFEAWHLPSRSGGDDGVHVICTSAGLLQKKIEKWEYDFFPINIWRFKKRLRGWHGMGAMEMCSTQIEGLNWLNDKLAQMLNHMTVRVAKPAGCKVVTEQLNNKPFSHYDYSNSPPVFMADPGPGQELFIERERFARNIYNRLGISELFSTSRKPSGLNSGVAIQEYNDTTSERFEDTHQRWEKWWQENGKLACWAAAQLTGYMTRYTDTKKMTTRKIKWSDVTMDEDQYQIQILPTSKLPREIAGRKDLINTLVQMHPEASGMFSKLIQDPDVDALISLLNAPMDSVLDDISRIQEGEEVTPMPYTALEMAVQYGQSSLMTLRHQSCPPKILSNLEAYVTAAQDMLLERQAQMQAQIQQQMIAQQPQPQNDPMMGQPPMQGLGA